MYAGTGIPDGDFSPRGYGDGGEIAPVSFDGDGDGDFFSSRGRGWGGIPDGEFPVAISSAVQ